MNYPQSTDANELREVVDALGGQLRAIVNQQKSIAGRAEAAGRDLTASESEKIDSLTSTRLATSLSSPELPLGNRRSCHEGRKQPG